MLVCDPLNPALPKNPGDRIHWGNLVGSGLAFTLAQAAQQSLGPLLVITPSSQKAAALKRELNFFCPSDLPCYTFPDWEILPYDHFSPHQDIISERLKTLYLLPQMKKGIILVPMISLAHRLIPKSYVVSNYFVLKVGDTLNLTKAKNDWIEAGYRPVSEVLTHGEFALRGSIIDIFPMGHSNPIRIDFFDDEVDSMRIFDVDTQRSTEKITEIVCLPAREYPLQDSGIHRFRSAWRHHFSGDPTQCPIYEHISQGLPIGGLEYYLPLFYESMQSLLDYLPEETTLVRCEHLEESLSQFWQDVCHRYEQYRHDITRPLLPPETLFFKENELFGLMKPFRCIKASAQVFPESKGQNVNLHFESVPALTLQNQADPAQALSDFVKSHPKRILFCAESAGRQEALRTILSKINITPKPFEHWGDFQKTTAPYGLLIAPLDQSFTLLSHHITFLAEGDLYGQQVMQRRRRKTPTQDPELAIRNLAELNIGDPVVHLEQGIGRYLGLTHLTIGESSGEYLTLQYAGQDKLYVPVTSLDLISQYSGVKTEHAPLHKLGTDTWDKAKRKAQKKAFDSAAEILEIHAQRAARQGLKCVPPDEEYRTFSNAFGFETTPDQQLTIDQVIEDLQKDTPMDRLVCGDVGFGKTEVALRAAFIAIKSERQVALLVPTTLLAQQHFDTFRDRFADWPIQIELLSRFRTKKEQQQTLENLKTGKTDIVIGTHKLLQEDLSFHHLGLLIIDEEHRFGVRQKEKMKRFRAQVDILTLTATPIPRTLNMALSSIRDLSIIATPPLKRLSIKTFVHDYQESLIQEAISRELMRGGQVYYLHNDVETIENAAEKIKGLCPEARVVIAHGQMPERQLEKVMSDFYHQRYNVLVCTTIIETGIDIPTANTILIDRADKFGLAQLHQLRGRVGRSHHQAYAYCLTPIGKKITPDAEKRLSALSALEELGSGFTLATHDLEIRGAGEILGQDQSGHMNEIGFNLYMELLEKAVASLKAGKSLSLDEPLLKTLEIDLNTVTLIPEDYCPDVHSRLILYKRMASCSTQQDLTDLEVEMIDRFGLLREPTKHLFKIAALKLKAKPLGIRKIEASTKKGKFEFVDNPTIDPECLLKIIRETPKHFKLISSAAFTFHFDMKTVEERFQVVENLLNQLTPNKSVSYQS